MESRLLIKWIYCLFAASSIAFTTTLKAEPYNYVVIVTDDQRFDSLWSMPNVLNKITSQGVVFDHAYVTTPSCCPSRASFLSGGYLPQNTGVLASSWFNGGFNRFSDANALAPLLVSSGYKTAMIGKYLNGYDYQYANGVPYLPPGWTVFQPAETFDNASLTLQALDFLNQHGNNPFFLYIAPYSPHYPATPSSTDTSLFPNFIYRGRGYGETDLSDKPVWVRLGSNDFNRVHFSSIAEQDDFHRDQLRTLQSVDRLVGDVMDWVETNGKLQNTVVIFTSDNGFMWGEHGLFEKNMPYEESIRVPLAIRVPGVAARTDSNLIVTNTDIPATILDLANIATASDGMSLAPLFSDPAVQWRTEFHIQTYGFSGKITARSLWSGLRRKDAGGDWKYVEYPTGEIELYDLLADPYELESKHNDPAYDAIRVSLSQSLVAQRGFAVTSLGFPEGQLGQPYFDAFELWGGTGPVSWTKFGGWIPGGITLDQSLGVLSGVPTEAGEFNVRLEGTDASIRTYSGENQSYIFESLITIQPADGDGVTNARDNCPALFNPDQKDTDGDGDGDVCDTDDDNDGLSDAYEIAWDGDPLSYNPLLDLNPLSPDTDGDWLTDFNEIYYDGNPTYLPGYDPDPLNYDTDGDGVRDGTEEAAGHSPLDGADFPIWGDINGDRYVDTADLIKAYRAALGLDTLTSQELARGNVAPLVGGQPLSSPDDDFNVADLYLIVKKVLGITTY